MRLMRRGLPFLLVLGLLLGIATFGTGIVVTDYLENDNTFCTACHLHEQKFADFHPQQGRHVTLAGAHNIAGEKNVKCIDCHIGATLTDKMVVKFLAAKDTVTYLVGTFEEPKALRYELGNRTCLKCHTTGGQNPAQDNAFHNAAHHAKLPLTCYACHTVHPTSTPETRFFRDDIVRPICNDCHKQFDQ